SILAEAEERARGLQLDARATADGVRAEGMEIVSELRQMGDALRSNSERLLGDIQAIHSRMLSRLEGVEAPGTETSGEGAERPSAPAGSGEPPNSEHSASSDEPASANDEELELPDFISPG